MKKLILMRHAEAQPSHLSPIDWERPLALEGLQQLERARKGVQELGTDVTLLLCSNARRTRQTFEAIRNVLPSKCSYQFTDKLYKATPETIIQLLQQQDDCHQAVFVIGHNPSLNLFVQAALNSNPTQKAKEITPATLVCFQGHFKNWSETAFTKLHVTSILRAL